MEKVEWKSGNKKRRAQMVIARSLKTDSFVILIRQPTEKDLSTRFFSAC